MNWDAVAAIAEAVGATGVIASLLYLAMQVRASTRASAVEAKLASSRMYTDFIAMLVQQPELNDIFLRGRKDIRSLNAEEYMRFSNMALIAFSFFSAAYFQYSNKTLSDADWFELRAITKYWVIGQGARDWWYKLGHLSFDKPFSDFIESEIRLASEANAAGAGGQPDSAEERQE